jgi:phage tail sheath protein FI
MPILRSPGVAIVEKDFSAVVGFNSSSAAAIAGEFKLGPLNQPILVSSVEELEGYFGKPTDANYKEWFSAWNYLQYASALWVTRIKATGVKNACALASGASAGITIDNAEVYETTSGATLIAAGEFICKQPGIIGNSLKVVAIDADTWAAFIADNTLTSESKHLKDYIASGAPNTSTYVAENAGNVSANDEIHIIVIDATGAITGVAGRILEVHEGLSKCGDAMDFEGRSIYYANYLNARSNWIYWANHPSTAGATGTLSWGILASAASTGSFKEMASLYKETFEAGTDGSLTDVDKTSALQSGYGNYINKDQYDIAYLITVDFPIAVTKYIIQSVAEVRKDCIAFISANDSSAPFFDKSTLVTNLGTFRDTTLNVNSSYAVLDSGYKYQFDGYNQKYRWVPLNGDVAGLCSRMDNEQESWYSPGGFNRGQIKNALKLSSVLDQASRDVLYPKQINPVVAFPGKGTVLFGDRTLQSKNSAFQSYHIRRLFIILEESIQDAAKYQLFELNSASTRGRFRGMVEPFLTSVKARDGLADFKVVCDSTNNPDDVAARGEFVADIYIKPLYSIQYIVLNFVATKSSVQFNQSVSG